MDGSTIAITPNQKLPSGTQRLTLGTGVADFAGNGLAAAKAHPIGG